jgi:phosphate transport system permease protein
VDPPPASENVGVRGAVPDPTPSPAHGTAGRRTWGLRVLAYLPALVPTFLVAALVIELLRASRLTVLPGFFGSNWDFTSAHPQWGIGVFVAGSFLTALPAIVFAILIGLGIGVASTTYLPRFVSRLLDPFVDLLAGIPSVVYGIWGFVVVGPYLGLTINPWVAQHLSFIPGVGGATIPQSGQGLPLAILLLTLMALPITTLLIRDALRSVPKDLWESGLALGATRWEVTRRVAIPYSNRGILSAGFLGFGRAFGETVAVAMVIGSRATFPNSVFDLTNTMASEIFQQTDASFVTPGLLEALAEIALVLLAISLLVNIAGRRLITSLISEQISGL